MASAPDTRELYLDAVERALTHSLYGVLDFRMDPGPGFKNQLIAMLLRILRSRGIEPIRMLPGDGELRREEGQDRPVFAQTMIGRKRLANVRACAETVITENVPGDLIEAGVWRGGAGIMVSAILKAYGVTDRRVWLADSFEGLPAPEPGKYKADAGAKWHEDSTYAVSLDEVRDNFRRYGLLDEQVQFLQGWFEATLTTVSDQTWALIRLDADMYGSTIEALSALYPNLSQGGFLIVDDYGVLEPARRAVNDYRAANDIREPMETIDRAGVYWRRAASGN